MIPLSPVHTWLAGKTGLGDRLSPATMQEYQFAQLKKTVAYAQQHSRYYASALAGIDPYQLDDFSALARLPLLEEKTLRLEPLSLLCVSQQKIARIITLNTSGTQGHPKRLFFSEQDIESVIDFFSHGLSIGAHPGGRVGIFLGDFSPDSTVNMLSKSLERMGVSAHFQGALADPCIALRHPAIMAADCLIGMPVQMMQMARMNPQLCPQTVLLGADYVPKSVIQTIESIWQCEVFAHYGSTESCIGGGFECQAHHGYHCRDADLLLEIIDPMTCEPVSHGMAGEIVLTTLSREAMPLIRYRTGDVGHIIDTPCSCGSSLHRLGTVTGRLENTFDVGNGVTVSIHMLDEIMFSREDVLDYTAVLDDESGLALVVRPFGEAHCAEIEEQVGQMLHDQIPVTVHVTNDQISSSKHKRAMRTHKACAA